MRVGAFYLSIAGKILLVMCRRKRYLSPNSCEILLAEDADRAIVPFGQHGSERLVSAVDDDQQRLVHALSLVVEPAEQADSR